MIDRYSSRKSIPRITPLAGADQRPLLDKIGKIARRSGEARTGDRPVISGTQSTRKSVRPFAEQAKQGLFLPIVDRAAQTIELSCLLDQEADAGNRPGLRLDDNIGKPRQPGIDVVALAAELKRGVIGFAVAMDRFRECRQRRGRQTLSQRLFSNGAPDPAIAVFKGMDALEPKVRDRGTGDCRKRIR